MSTQFSTIFFVSCKLKTYMFLESYPNEQKYKIGIKQHDRSISSIRVSPFPTKILPSRLRLQQHSGMGRQMR